MNVEIDRDVALGKEISCELRHAPQKYGLDLDSEGRAEIGYRLRAHELHPIGPGLLRALPISGEP